MFRRLMGRLCLLALSCSALDPFAPLAHADTVPALRIGEVAWAGSSLSTADEWLELWNTGDTPLSLAGYRLEGASASPIIFNSTSTIPAYSTFLIANYDGSDTKSVLATSTQLVTTAVSLSNSSLRLALYGPDNTLIDEVPLGAPPAGSSSPKASMIRSATSTAWYSATTMLFMKPGTTDFGTPGYCDGCVIPELPATTPIETIDPIVETDPDAELEDATIIEEQPTTTIETITTTTTELEPVIEMISVDATTTADLTATTTDEVVTSTEAEIPTVTSTEPVQEPLPESAPVPAPIITPVPTPVVTAPIPVTTTPAPSLKLQAVFPAPDNAKEWVDVTWTNDTHDLARLDGWSLQNGRNKMIFRFATSTRPTLIEHDDLVRITFNSSVLLNAGDTVSLYDATGALADRMSYDKTPKGSTWIFNGTWQNPDLNDAKAVTPPPLTLPSLEERTTESKTTAIKTTATKAKTTSKKETTKTTRSLDDASLARDDKKTKTASVKTAAIKKPTTTKKAPTKKTSSTTASTIIHPTTIEQILMQPQSWRVRVQGVVGTVPGILAKRQFILHAPDGRGLLIKLPTGQKTPKLGSTVELTGSVTEDDDGIMLTMKTKDTWTLVSADTITIPTRAVDVLAEEIEDTWSKISVTGTILSISGGKAELDADGIHVTAIIKAAVRYRVQRLKKGDLLKLTGVLSFTKDGPALYPVTTEDITVLQSASVAKPTTAKTTMPDWIPFGAAGATVAAYEGFKRWRKRKPLTKEILTIA